MMKGWKTWVAGGLSIVYGVIGFIVELHGMEAMISFVSIGLGMLGIGHKIEKASNGK